ncbi:MAG TPA: universal stress protein [Nitrospirota bacterium]|jgi:nucleotide-binding universal stress UspA family protein
MRDILKKFENAMASAAFAEAGEFNTAREMYGKNSNKKVLLGTEGTEVDHKAFRYASNLCQRVGAKLEILYILRPSLLERGKNLEELLGEVKSGLKNVFESLIKEGIDYSLNFGEGRLEDEVARYAEGRSDILFVVMESSGLSEEHRSRLEKRLSVATEKLKCPLVVVTDAIKA